jgi:hypothetical protein
MNYYNNYYKSNSKTKVFISFDFDHDEDLKNLFVGQAKHEDTPFEIIDMSVKEELSGDWKEKARQKIKKVDQVVVICGKYTDTATGVSAEVRISQEENKPYFLLWGRKDETCKKPKSTKDEDKIYTWTWDNVKKLLDGQR